MSLSTHTRPLGVAAFPSIGPLANPHVRTAAIIIAGVLFLAVMAQVSLTLPFSSNRAGEPVPVTGQTFGVLFLAATLGLRRGLATVMVYLAVGGAGLPVFAGAGSGLGVLFTGSTAGYLWGFLLATAFIGFLVDRGVDRGPWFVASLVVGHAMIYASGLAVLALWLSNNGISGSLLHFGLWPFIPGDLLKIALVATLVPAGWAAFGKLRS
jgi:biotin transport system substrate-specific component